VGRFATSFLIAGLLVGSARAAAQTIALSGPPAAMKITTAVPGSQPTAITDALTTYTVTTPAANKTYKITASLNANMPANVTLVATLAAPAGGTSQGPKTLTTVAQDMVLGIPKNTSATPMITYTLSATVLAGVITSTNRTVNYTIVQFP
jgi:hypothetical protein